MKRLVVIDGNAIIHRAYHAIPPMTTKDGTMVNAVYGFISMMLKVWKELDPEYMVVTFDMKGPTFRHKKFKEYKATRVKADQELYDQIPITHKVVEAFNIPIFEAQGYEADDVIATIVKTAKKKDKENELEVMVVTGDMDTLQLVKEGVKIYTMRKGMSDIVIYDTNQVKNRYEFGPEMVVDYKALRGDPSDNIPGVPGVGEKTATILIKEIGGIEEVYKQISNKNSKIFQIVKEGIIKKLIDGKEKAFMSKDLAILDYDVPNLDFNLEKAVLKDFNKEKVISFFQKMEFFSLLKRVPGYESTKKNIEQKEANKFNSTKITFINIKEQKEVEELIDKIKKEKRFAVKTVINGLDIFTSKLEGLAVVSGNNGFYISKEFLENFLPIFSEEELVLAGHDLKQLVKIFLLNNFKIKNKLFDVMLGSYLLHSGSRAHDLKHIAFKVLGKELPKGSSQMGLFGHDPKIDITELGLIMDIMYKLKKDLEDAKDLDLFQKIEMPLIFVLAQMEINGIAIDSKILNEMAVKVKKEINEISKKMYEMAGEEFNISSPLQLREILFKKMDISSKGIKKGKTGLSTSAEQLEKLRGLHPIVEEIEKYRELSKLKNTYIDVLPTLVNKKTKRIHSSFNQAVTATGRLSSSDPNLQNIPIRTKLGREIRKAFVAEEGNLLVSADYSQIELRIVASLAKDKKMMEIFERDEDIHAATAGAINDIDISKVTKEMRRSAKEINFGILYGMGAYGLSWRADIPRYQARDFIKKYFEEFSGVKKYMDGTLEFARKNGYVETLFGRRRYIPELNSDNFQLRASGERMAINHPVQGTAADLMKMAMISVSEKLNNIKMVLQVHDEMVFEIEENKAEDFSKEVKKIMENVVKLDVPVKVDVNISKSWGEMK